MVKWGECLRREVSFHCWDNRCSDTSDSFTIFVKMDGYVIEPEVTPKQKDATNDEIQRIKTSACNGLG